MFSFSTVKWDFGARAEACALVYFTLQAVSGHAYKECELSAIKRVATLSLSLTAPRHCY
jgi:hypothetical protein